MYSWENPLNEALYNGNAERYEIDFEELNKLFFNDIDTIEKQNPMSRKRFDVEDALGCLSHNKKGEEVLVDIENLYFQNENYFRCSEANVKTPCGPVDIIFSGCSFTYGIGVPEECIWGSSLSKKMQMSYQNISMPGSSVDWAIDSIISYISKHGKPKFIFCLFPSFSRMTFVFNPNKNYSTNDKKTIISKKMRISKIQLGHQDQDWREGTYQKIPFVVEDVIPQELAYLISIRKILFLEQYCKDSGIEMLWSTWDGELERVLRFVQKNIKKYSNFIFINNHNWVKNKDCTEDFVEDLDPNREKVLCHLELMDKYPRIFDRGGDIEVDVSLSHFGVHRHEHIAETFFKALKENK